MIYTISYFIALYSPQDQYIFINDAILESITCGDTQIITANVRITVNKMTNTDPSTGQNGFQHQFQVYEFV